jgi:ribosomal protein S12 methylthiotransferase accessory factor
MVTDPGLVRSMSDHSLCNATPEAFDRFSFLLDGDRVIDWDQVSPWPWPRHTDLRDDVTAAIDRMLVGGMDVIVVDQTASLHEPAGLRCVKVIAPGSLSMTFGHGNRRITGLPRLFEIPYRLGHASRPLTDADLNPDPHPFP